MGGLTLAVCPAFWAQTGGSEGTPATIVLALGVAGLVALAGSVMMRRPALALGVAVTIFAGLFWMQIGTARSIRLTGFTTSWLMFLLIDMLFITNPHPTESTPPAILRFKSADAKDEERTPQFYHLWGIILLFGLGILNDPLMVLLAPAIALALYLTRAKLSSLYGVLFGLIVGLGLRGLFVDYVQGQSHRLALEAWRQGRRWSNVVTFIVAQFGWPATLLSVLGLTRLSRWYPALGNVSLIGYAAYVGFALVYDGRPRARCCCRCSSFRSYGSRMRSSRWASGCCIMCRIGACGCGAACFCCMDCCRSRCCWERCLWHDSLCSVTVQSSSQRGSYGFPTGYQQKTAPKNGRKRERFCMMCRELPRNGQDAGHNAR
ncbi:hypothetical protein HC776_01150 [bacterium]|nr:hypothetical protein [bacterium]